MGDSNDTLVRCIYRNLDQTVSETRTFHLLTNQESIGGRKPSQSNAGVLTNDGHWVWLFYAKKEDRFEFKLSHSNDNEPATISEENLVEYNIYEIPALNVDQAVSIDINGDNDYKSEVISIDEILNENEDLFEKLPIITADDFNEDINTSQECDKDSLSLKMGDIKPHKISPKIKIKMATESLDSICGSSSEVEEIMSHQNTNKLSILLPSKQSNSDPASSSSDRILSDIPAKVTELPEEDEVFACKETEDGLIDIDKLLLGLATDAANQNAEHVIVHSSVAEPVKARPNVIVAKIQALFGFGFRPTHSEIVEKPKEKRIEKEDVDEHLKFFEEKSPSSENHNEMGVLDQSVGNINLTENIEENVIKFPQENESGICDSTEKQSEIDTAINDNKDDEIISSNKIDEIINLNNNFSSSISEKCFKSMETIGEENNLDCSNSNTLVTDIENDNTQTISLDSISSNKIRDDLKYRKDTSMIPIDISNLVYNLNSEPQETVKSINENITFENCNEMNETEQLLYNSECNEVKLEESCEHALKNIATHDEANAFVSFATEKSFSKPEIIPNLFGKNIANESECKDLKKNLREENTSDVNTLGTNFENSIQPTILLDSISTNEIRDNTKHHENNCMITADFSNNKLKEAEEFINEGIIFENCTEMNEYEQMYNNSECNEVKQEESYERVLDNITAYNESNALISFVKENSFSKPEIIHNQLSNDISKNNLSSIEIRDFNYEIPIPSTLDCSETNLVEGFTCSLENISSNCDVNAIVTCGTDNPFMNLEVKNYIYTILEEVIGSIEKEPSNFNNSVENGELKDGELKSLNELNTAVVSFPGKEINENVKIEIVDDSTQETDKQTIEIKQPYKIIDNRIDLNFDTKNNSTNNFREPDNEGHHIRSSDQLIALENVSEIVQPFTNIENQRSTNCEILPSLNVETENIIYELMEEFEENHHEKLKLPVRNPDAESLSNYLCNQSMDAESNESSIVTSLSKESIDNLTTDTIGECVSNQKSKDSDCSILNNNLNIDENKLLTSTSRQLTNQILSNDSLANGILKRGDDIEDIYFKVNSEYTLTKPDNDLYSSQIECEFSDSTKDISFTDELLDSNTNFRTSLPVMTKICDDLLINNNRINKDVFNSNFIVPQSIVDEKRLSKGASISSNKDSAVICDSDSQSGLGPLVIDDSYDEFFSNHLMTTSQTVDSQFESTMSSIKRSTSDNNKVYEATNVNSLNTSCTDENYTYPMDTSTKSLPIQSEESLKQLSLDETFDPARTDKFLILNYQNKPANDAMKLDSNILMHVDYNSFQYDFPYIDDEPYDGEERFPGLYYQKNDLILKARLADCDECTLSSVLELSTRQEIVTPISTKKVKWGNKLFRCCSCISRIRR